MNDRLEKFIYKHSHIAFTDMSNIPAAATDNQSVGGQSIRSATAFRREEMRKEFPKSAQRLPAVVKVIGFRKVLNILEKEP